MCVWFSVFPDELELGCNPQLRSNISVVLWFQGLPQGFVFYYSVVSGFPHIGGCGFRGVFHTNVFV